MKKVLLTLSAAATGIVFASAQTVQNTQINGAALVGLLNLAQDILSRLIPFAITLAVVAFFWFLIKFIMKSADPKDRADSLKGMGLSVLALFVMVSIWGIVGFMANLTGIGQGGTIPVPTVPRPSN
jgi:hypothetical protein